MRHGFRQKLIRSLPVPLLCALVLFSSCRSGVKSAPSFTETGSVFLTPRGEDRLYHASAASASAVAGEGEWSLLFDPAAACVFVRDNARSLVWSALPEAGALQCASFSLTVRGEKGVYLLNTQDHAAAFSSFSYKTDGGALRVDYVLSDRSDVANRQTSELSPGDLQVRFSVIYTLGSGTLTVTLPAESFFVSEGYAVETLSVLPYFGSVVYGQETAAAAPAEETPDSDEDVQTVDAEAENAYSDAPYDDYLLVPDGCGAVIYTRFTDETNRDLTYVVSPEPGRQASAASLGAFGIRQGEKSFVCTVTGGASLAEIRALQQTDGVRRVCSAYADMRLTATLSDGGRVYYGGRTADDITLVYRFLNGLRSDPVAMADACRETLIRAGGLREASLGIDRTPLNLSVLCSVSGETEDVQTDFAQAEDLLTQLKGKGVDSVNLFLLGAFGGGLAQEPGGALTPAAALGGEDAFRSLCEYASLQNYRVLPGVDLLYSSERDAARKLNGQTVRIRVPMGSFSAAGAQPSAFLIKADLMEKNTLRILDAVRSLGLQGVYAADAASAHYTDLGHENGAGADAAAAEQLRAIASAGTLALGGVNGAMLRDADLFTDLPYEPAHPQTDSYVGVPFLPAILHGSALYSGPAFNTAGASRLAFLKCVEYGGVPYYAWNSDASSPLYFASSLAEAAENIRTLQSELGDLCSERISGHRKLANGVFRTDYGNGSSVFVNYNHYSVLINGVSLPPYDFLRMN